MINIKPQTFIWYLIIFIIIVIIIKLIPFYNYDFDKIYENNEEIIIYSTKSINKSEWIITINWNQIQINAGFHYLPLDTKTWQLITFASKNKNYNTYIFIQFKNNIVKIQAQSAIFINQHNKNIEITIINWSVEYLNTNQNNKILFIWKNKPLNLDQNDIYLKNTIKDKLEKQKKYIINLYWWYIILNRSFDYIIHNLILLFNRISPDFYKDNLQNYNNFKYYINTIDKNITLWNSLNFNKNEKNNINKDLLKQFDKWLSKTLNFF